MTEYEMANALANRLRLAATSGELPAGTPLLPFTTLAAIAIQHAIEEGWIPPDGNQPVFCVYGHEHKSSRTAMTCDRRWVRENPTPTTMDDIR